MRQPGTEVEANRGRRAWLWLDYVGELAPEAAADPAHAATVVAIGIHPFVFGTPNGAAALRRVLEELKAQKLVWVAEVKAVLDAASVRQ